MRTTLKDGTRIQWAEPKGHNRDRWLIFLAIVLAAILLSGCSVNTAELHHNLDMERNLENVEIERNLIVSPLFSGGIRCSLATYRYSTVSAGTFKLVSALSGSPQFGCAIWGPEPRPKRSWRIDAVDVFEIQRDTCKDIKCWCKIWYFPDPLGIFEGDELDACKGNTDHREKVAKLKHGESLFDKSQQDR